MTPRITLLVASLHALLYVALSLRVVLLRKGRGVGIGTGGDAELARAVRVHGNFAEYVPLTLLLMALCELAGVGALWLHRGGGLLLLGRILHAIGIQIPKAPNKPRLFGTLFFWLSLGLFSVLALVQGLSFG